MRQSGYYLASRSAHTGAPKCTLGTDERPSALLGGARQPFSTLVQEFARAALASQMRLTWLMQAVARVLQASQLTILGMISTAASVH